jgi:1A family penicillin-binding protein
LHKSAAMPSPLRAWLLAVIQYVGRLGRAAADTRVIRALHLDAVMRRLEPFAVRARWSWQMVRQRVPLRRIGILAASVVLVVCVAGAIEVVRAWRELPSPDAIARIGDMDRATVVYDHDGHYAFSIARERRLVVPLSSIAPTMTKAIVAVEDRRFYSHPGFDVRRIAAAALANIRRRRAAQGGSTITQQLARQSFLRPEKTLRRKLQELLLARRIEHAYAKSQILEMYLNKVYFGDGLYGVEAASRGYLGKHASELTVADAALLAGLVKSPSSDAPTINPQRAAARRNLVLNALADTGAIDRATWQASRAVHIRLQDGLRQDERRAQYFKEQVRRELVERFGSQTTAQGGLRVFSTVDMSMQAAAETALSDSLRTLDGRLAAQARRRPAQGADQEGGAPLQAALIALDPQTGAVRAMIGGRNFADSSFNRAVQARRQPGSAFKPIVYAAALESGYTPATLLEHLDEPIATKEGAWTPEEQHETADSMSVRAALRISSNRAAVHTLADVGIPRAVRLAETMGLGKLPGVPSLALGSGEVTLQSLTAAYAAFANHGLVTQPSVIRRVEDPAGHVLYEAGSVPQRVMSDSTAFLMSSLLADVVNSGTAARVRALGFSLPAAGKTGTTSDFNDAWFVGYTPKLVAGVWIGFDEPRTILPDAFAADVAVPAWTAFMKGATRGDRPQWLATPSTVTSARVCRLSGKLATPACEHAGVDAPGDDDRRPMVYTEYFAAGTEPTAVCDRHLLVQRLAAIAHLPAPERPQAIAPPDHPESVASSGTESPAVEKPATEESPKTDRGKRSIWSRIFGGRR